MIQWDRHETLTFLFTEQVMSICSEEQILTAAGLVAASSPESFDALFFRKSDEYPEMSLQFDIDCFQPVFLRFRFAPEENTLLFVLTGLRPLQKQEIPFALNDERMLDLVEMMTQTPQAYLVEREHILQELLSEYRREEMLRRLQKLSDRVARTAEMYGIEAQRRTGRGYFTAEDSTAQPYTNNT